MRKWSQYVNMAVVDATAAVTSTACAEIRGHLQDAVTNMQNALESFLDEEEQDQDDPNREADNERD